MNEDEYVGLQVLLAIGLPLVLLLFNSLLDQNYPWYAIVGIGLFGVPIRICMSKELRANGALNLVDLPFVIDLLALSTEAGLDFIGCHYESCRKQCR